MKPVRLAAAVAGLVVSLTVATGAQGHRKDVTATTLAALEPWIQAVKTHTPGRVDDSVVIVAGFSYETREEMNAGMSLFLSALMARTVKTDGNKAAETIVALGRASGASFLKQAAVLHSDAAAYTDLYPVQSSAPANSAGSPTRDVQVGTSTPMSLSSDDPVPPLLRADRVVLDKDGQVLGQVLSTWHWPFARSLLDLLSEGRVRRAGSGAARATDPFVVAWYHATTAYMFASGLYGEATEHLHQAAEVLPDDAQILFDRGCYAEILGLPMHQALLSHPGAPPRIPSADKTNADAERLFRRALASDPSLVEARVRLARLLDLRGRREEAAAELKTALAGNPTGVVAFYARLFAGRTAQSMGRTDEAARHYEEAAALFPDAQSALLAASQLALLRSDVAGTLAPVQRLGARSVVFTADPWWQYHLATGRDADVLLKALWASVPQERSAGGDPLNR